MMDTFKKPESTSMVKHLHIASHTVLGLPETAFMSLGGWGSCLLLSALQKLQRQGLGVLKLAVLPGFSGSLGSNL